MSGQDDSWLNSLSDDALIAMSDAEFDALTGQVADLLVEGPVEVERNAPSEALWDSIVAGLGDELATAPTGVVIDPSSPAAGPAARRAGARWGGRTAIITMIAAAMLLVAIPAGLAIRGSGDSTDVLATATLEGLNGFTPPQPASADLVKKDGKSELALNVPQVAITEAEAKGEYVELWLLHVDASGQPDGEMTSLGEVDGSGLYPVDPTLTEQGYVLVDLSFEPHDGVATHSGNSILRGQLTY